MSQGSNYITGVVPETQTEFQLRSWLPNSTDLNPIDHIWDVIKRVAQSSKTIMSKYPGYVWPLFEHLVYNLPSVIHQRFVVAVPRRVAADLPADKWVIRKVIIQFWLFSVYL